jgi:hypothetical protein
MAPLPAWRMGQLVSANSLDVLSGGLADQALDDHDIAPSALKLAMVSK